jgi:DNA-binding NtrC family response regulator
MRGNHFSILIVDDEKKIVEILQVILEGQGYNIHRAFNCKDALKIVQKQQIDLILLDIKMPDMNGIDVLQKIKTQYPVISIVMISAFGTISLAVEAMKLGADDFIEKPLERNRVLTTIRNVLEKKELQQQSTHLISEIVKQYRILGETEQIKKVLEFIDRVAATNSTVLITGESGTGKELVARGIHLKSVRAAKPFVKVNCAALPGELIESELFGYEKGAFTGATTRKLGQFEIADCGTLFLDEIGDMSLQAQAKVLRASEDNEIMRLGGVEPFKIDARLLAATNKNLNDMIKQKTFRDDLYHRINVLNIAIPPLRNRQDDIPLLADHFLRNACIESNRPPKYLDTNATRLLMNYHWPGNVRELKHLMEKIAVLADNDTIDGPLLEELLNPLAAGPGREKAEEDIDNAREKFERQHILDILKKTEWKILEAAKILGIDRSTLFRKMRKLGIKQSSS